MTHAQIVSACWDTCNCSSLQQNIEVDQSLNTPRCYWSIPVGHKKRLRYQTPHYGKLSASNFFWQVKPEGMNLGEEQSSVPNQVQSSYTMPVEEEKSYAIHVRLHYICKGKNPEGQKRVAWLNRATHNTSYCKSNENWDNQKFNSPKTENRYMDLLQNNLIVIRETLHSRYEEEPLKHD